MNVSFFLFTLLRIEYKVVYTVEEILFDKNECCKFDKITTTLQFASRHEKQ